MADLGKIEKPHIESFAGKRKLYCVPGVHPVEEAPEEYQTLYRRFWDEVDSQIERLEQAGRVTKVFCEHLTAGGEEALGVLRRFNERIAGIVERKQREGAELVPMEREDLLGPYLDWSNCLAVVATEEVASRILEFYRESFDRRLRFMLNAITTGLGEGEAGLLVISDQQRTKLQFPQDIEVFLVTPPAYDDILRWMRQHMRDLDEGQE